MKNFSLVIPVYNEEYNIKSLINEITYTLKKYADTYEIIIVNDGSTDSTPLLLNELQSKNKIILINNSLNKGQSFSIYNGIKNSKYNTIVTLDGDGQNDPKDILILLDIFFSNKNFSLVGGIRIKRKDSLIKIYSSKIANKIRKFILKDNCDDTGCSLKVFRKEIFMQLPYFNGIHRYIPALFLGKKCKTFFVPVDHRIRKFGRSNYGTFNRLIKGIYDIIKVKKIIRTLDTK